MPSPFPVGWTVPYWPRLLGWLSAEFAPHVLTGHALSAFPTPLARLATDLAVQRADSVLTDVLHSTFGEDYEQTVYHPVEPYTSRELGVGRVIDAMRHRRRYCAATRDISYGPLGRSNLLDIWRRPDLADGHRAPVLIQIPGGGWSINDEWGVITDVRRVTYRDVGTAVIDTSGAVTGYEYDDESFFAPYLGLVYSPRKNIKVQLGYGIDPVNYVDTPVEGRGNGRERWRERYLWNHSAHDVVDAERALEDARTISVMAVIAF